MKTIQNRMISQMDFKQSCLLLERCHLNRSPFTSINNNYKTVFHLFFLIKVKIIIFKILTRFTNVSSILIYVLIFLERDMDLRNLKNKQKMK